MLADPIERKSVRNSFLAAPEARTEQRDPLVYFVGFSPPIRKTTESTLLLWLQITFTHRAGHCDSYAPKSLQQPLAPKEEGPKGESSRPPKRMSKTVAPQSVENEEKSAALVYKIFPPPQSSKIPTLLYNNNNSSERYFMKRRKSSRLLRHEQRRADSPVCTRNALRNESGFSDR